MERTKNKTIITQVEAETRKSWKKVGGGSARLTIDGRDRIIKPNEAFLAYDIEIPFAFRDVIICLSKDIPVAAPIIQNVTTIYKKVSSKEEKGMFDIVDGLGKLMNEKPLTKEIAEQFLSNLTS